MELVGYSLVSEADFSLHGKTDFVLFPREHPWSLEAVDLVGSQGQVHEVFLVRRNFGVDQWKPQRASSRSPCLIREELPSPTSLWDSIALDGLFWLNQVSLYEFQESLRDLLPVVIYLGEGNSLAAQNEFYEALPVVPLEVHFCMGMFATQVEAAHLRKGLQIE